jgi:ribosomal protein S1
MERMEQGTKVKGKILEINQAGYAWVDIGQRYKAYLHCSKLKSTPFDSLKVGDTLTGTLNIIEKLNGKKQTELLEVDIT